MRWNANHPGSVAIDNFIRCVSLCVRIVYDIKVYLCVVCLLAHRTTDWVLVSNSLLKMTTFWISSGGVGEIKKPEFQQQQVLPQVQQHHHQQHPQPITMGMSPMAQSTVSVPLGNSAIKMIKGHSGIYLIAGDYIWRLIAGTPSSFFLIQQYQGFALLHSKFGSLSFLL